jgi:zinc protease
VPTGFPNLVSVTIPVQTGSRNEVEPGKSGFAHFFEHMMFRGTKAYPPEKYQDIITKAGARQNAYTSDDLTNYYTTFAKEDLETMLKVEADRFQHLTIREGAFKTESRAVLGEYNKNSANPMQKLFEVQRDAAFSTHTYKHTTMGFLKDIEDMPNQYQYSKVFFDRWYRPERTTIIIAGDVDPKKAIAWSKNTGAAGKKGSYKAAVPSRTGPAWRPVPPRAMAEPDPAAGDGRLPRPGLLRHREGPGRAVDAAVAVLRPHLAAVQAPGAGRAEGRPAVRLHAGRVDPTLATIGARVKKPADALYVRDAILQTVGQLRDTPVTKQALADAKSAEKYGLIRTLDNTEQIAGPSPPTSTTTAPTAR